MSLITAQELDRAGAEDQLRAEFRKVGMKWTRERGVTFRAFLQSTGPVTVDGLHRLAKKELITVSYASVYRTAKTLVACGMAQEQMVENGRTMMYVNVQSKNCLHTHLVCKDCGALIEPEKL